LDFNGLRVYFGPCGIGLGHIGRVIPVAEEVQRQGGEILVSTYLEAVDFAKKRGLPVVSSPAMSLETDSTGSIDLKASALSQGIPTMMQFVSQITAEMDFMKAFKPDVVVSDTRLSSLIAGKLLGKPVALILNQFLPMIPRENNYKMLGQLVDGSILTLIGGGWGSSDVILIPDFPEPYTLSLDSLRIPSMHKNLVKMVGFILPKKPEDVSGVERVRAEAGVENEEHLIYAAISGPSKERDPLIQLLEPIFREFPNEYKVVMSMGRPDGGSVPFQNGSLTKIPWVQDRYEYLKACDMAISRGGHNTIMQSICYGNPSIIIPTPNHTEQYANARRAKELDLAEALHQKDVTKELLVNTAEKLLKEPRYKDKLNQINSLEMSNGLENILTEIKKLTEK